MSNDTPRQYNPHWSAAQERDAFSGNGDRPPSSDIKALQNAITHMDTVSQEGFSQIAAIARTVLASMEAPKGYAHPDDIAKLMGLIWTIADNNETMITSEADDVGCNARDVWWMRRLEARHAYKVEQAKEAEMVRLNELAAKAKSQGGSQWDSQGGSHG